MVYTLAHVSDWHVTSPEGGRLRDLANKRLLGWLSWRQRRQYRHRPDVLRALFEDLGREAPDHVAVTGDLTNIALPHEFEEAAGWLADLGPPEWISLIPGNHDAYVPVPRSCSWDLWAEYMVSDESRDAHDGAAPLAAPRDDEFPTVRIRGPVALVGASSALPTPPGFASGRLGDEQLERLARTLAELKSRELCCVLLIHHSPLDEGFTPRRRLRDAEALREVLAQVGADLVLHGHGHKTLVSKTAGPEGGIPVVGVRSSSHVETLESRRAQYHLLRIERAGVSQGRRFRFGLETRGYDAASGGFVAEGSRSL